MILRSSEEQDKKRADLSAHTDEIVDISLAQVTQSTERRAVRQFIDVPLPRPKRNKRRAKADRGLPPDEELANLAKAYLERQRKHWPSIAAAGLLPEPVPSVLQQMVTDFKDRHRTSKVDAESVRPFLKFAKNLGGVYVRYSCHNSSPTSALDQMVNSLDKAQQQERFVPWTYVFGDYSVTGLDAGRQGYKSFKEVLANKAHFIETTFIDDFTRASRDELEWWRLAALSKRFGKRMIGASDGFDLSNAMWDMHVTIFGLLSRLFIKGLREKVRRGMRGAARRGTCLGKQPLGYTRCVYRDEHGQQVFDPDGLPIYKPCIDPETSQYRLLAYELFVNQDLSAYKIARQFCELKVDGWDGWKAATIVDLLRSPTAIGVFIWNKTRREYDADQEKTVEVQNPHSEWEVYYDPESAIAPMDLYRAARRKLAALHRASPRTGKSPSRNQQCANTLFSGTLFCEYCGEELKLIRSTEKSKQLGCINGVQRLHGCKLHSSKSVRIIEECLLGFLRETILANSQVESLVLKANAALQLEAEKPEVDTAPLRAKSRRLDSKIKKLVAMIEDEPEKDLCLAHNRRVKELQKELNSLSAQVREADRAKRKPAKLLSVKKVCEYLVSFREVLSQEIPVAATALRALTGPITVRQENLPGRRRARWIATFSPDLLQVLRYLAEDKSEIPAAAIGTEMGAIDVPIDKVAKYELLAPLFKKLRDEGMSVNSIASMHGMAWTQANEILKFADTGLRPKRPKPTGEGSGFKKVKYKEIAKKAVELHDKQKLTFARIGEQLGVSTETATRAYKHGKSVAAGGSAGAEKDSQKARSNGLSADKTALMQKLLRTKAPVIEIASTVGCGISSVYRMLHQMRDDGEEM